MRWGRRREHHGGCGHEPDKVVAAGAHLSSGSTMTGAEGGFSGGALATGSSSGGDGGSGDVLEHWEVNRGGEAGSRRDGRMGRWSSLREGSSGGCLDSPWGGDSAGCRSGEEEKGREGARFRSRRDADRGESKKGVRRLSGRERQAERGGPWRGGRRPALARGRRAWAGGTHMCGLVLSRGGRALTSRPRLQCRGVKFNLNSNSN
jgi:hypothetical protein